MIATEPKALSPDADSFVRARPRLLSVARRVLANPADADDVVQDAWMRWQDTDRSAVRDPVAFLATTTRRLAINVGQSAHARRETASAQHPGDTADPEADPALGAERRHAVELALREILEALSPTERAVYLLREAFDYPHARIAAALGLSEANARQLAARARRRVADDARHRPVGAREHRRLVDAFLAATETGDLAQFERVLVTDMEDAHVRLAA
jgi:RNA polymerase sigma-70 factor, ECF subfamily